MVDCRIPHRVILKTSQSSALLITCCESAHPILKSISVAVWRYSELPSGRTTNHNETKGLLTFRLCRPAIMRVTMVFVDCGIEIDGNDSVFILQFEHCSNAVSEMWMRLN